MGQVTGAAQLETAQKTALALEWRKAGYSYPRIAEELGITQAYAHKLVKKALKQLIKPAGDEVLKLEIERLDQLFIKCYERATDPNYPDRVSKDSIEMALKIMARRAALLGLDKPVKVAATDPTGEHEATTPLVSFYLPNNGRDPVPEEAPPPPPPVDPDADDDKDDDA